MELINKLTDSARALPGTPESTCSCGGEFRMLRDLTYTIVNCRSSSDLGAALRETLRGSETAALWDTWCLNLKAVVLTQPQGIWSYHISLCYSHRIHYIIICHALYKSLCIYTYGQSGRRWYWSIFGGAPGHAH
jgi:hypothetical protein